MGAAVGHPCASCRNDIAKLKESVRESEAVANDSRSSHDLAKENGTQHSVISLPLRQDQTRRTKVQEVQHSGFRGKETSGDHVRAAASSLSRNEECRVLCGTAENSPGWNAVWEGRRNEVIPHRSAEGSRAANAERVGKMHFGFVAARVALRSGLRQRGRDFIFSLTPGLRPGLSSAAPTGAPERCATSALRIVLLLIRGTLFAGY